MLYFIWLLVCLVVVWLFVCYDVDWLVAAGLVDSLFGLLVASMTCCLVERMIMCN